MAEVAREPKKKTKRYRALRILGGYKLMKKAFLLSAAAAVSLITFGGIQQASAKELLCQHVVTVKKGNTCFLFSR